MLELLGLIVILIVACATYVLWRAFRLRAALRHIQTHLAKLGEELQERDHNDPTGSP